MKPRGEQTQNGALKVDADFPTGALNTWPNACLQGQPPCDLSIIYPGEIFYKFNLVHYET